MYDVNPLGPLTHLKELERQAISRAYRNPGKSRSNIFALLRERLAILLQRINMPVAGKPGIQARRPVTSNSPLES